MLLCTNQVNLSTHGQEFTQKKWFKLEYQQLIQWIGTCIDRTTATMTTITITTTIMTTTRTTTIVATTTKHILNNFGLLELTFLSNSNLK